MKKWGILGWIIVLLTLAVILGIFESQLTEYVAILMR